MIGYVMVFSVVFKVFRHHFLHSAVSNHKAVRIFVKMFIIFKLNILSILYCSQSESQMFAMLHREHGVASHK